MYYPWITIILAIVCACIGLVLMYYQFMLWLLYKDIEDLVHEHWRNIAKPWDKYSVFLHEDIPFNRSADQMILQQHLVPVSFLFFKYFHKEFPEPILDLFQARYVEEKRCLRLWGGFWAFFVAAMFSFKAFPF